MTVQRKAKRATTALARRPVSKKVTPKKQSLMPASKPKPEVVKTEQLRELTDSVSLGNLGLVEIKLTPEEEAVLNEPVPVEEIRIKPTGAAYLSHPTYTRWFNRAFGRTGWSIAACSKPLKSGNTVVCPYILYIHGQPAAMAWGEQDYIESNKEQTYGDALESTVASALRRLAKRLGVGLEMWDKDYLADWQHANCVMVWLKDKDKPAYRRRQDLPFWNEVPAGSRRSHTTDRAEAREERKPPPADRLAGGNPDGELAITADQVRKFWGTARRMNRTEDEVKAFLKGVYHIAATTAIKRKDFEQVVKFIEAPGPLPIGRSSTTPSREAGEEG